LFDKIEINYLPSSLLQAHCWGRHADWIGLRCGLERLALFFLTTPSPRQIFSQKIWSVCVGFSHRKTPQTEKVPCRIIGAVQEILLLPFKRYYYCLEQPSHYRTPSNHPSESGNEAGSVTCHAIVPFVT
jgi:hypothetical protein